MSRRVLVRLLLLAALLAAHQLLADRLAGIDLIAQLLVSQDVIALAQLGALLLIRLLCVVVVPAGLAAWAASYALRRYERRAAEEQTAAGRPVRKE